jgi:hypothetical protein
MALRSNPPRLHSIAEELRNFHTLQDSYARFGSLYPNDHDFASGHAQEIRPDFDFKAQHKTEAESVVRKPAGCGE